MPEGWKPGDPLPDLPSVPAKPAATAQAEAMREAEDALVQQQPKSAASSDEDDPQDLEPKQGELHFSCSRLLFRLSGIIFVWPVCNMRKFLRSRTKKASCSTVGMVLLA